MSQILWQLCAPAVIWHASAKENISCLVWLSARDVPCGLTEASCCSTGKTIPNLSCSGNPSAESSRQKNVALEIWLSSVFICCHITASLIYVPLLAIVIVLFYVSFFCFLLSRIKSCITPFTQLCGFVTLEFLTSVGGVLFSHLDGSNFLWEKRKRDFVSEVDKDNRASPRQWHGSLSVQSK